MQYSSWSEFGETKGTAAGGQLCHVDRAKFDRVSLYNILKGKVKQFVKF